MIKVIWYPLEDINKVLGLMKDTNLNIRTLHIHTGSEIKDVEVFAKGIEVLFGLVHHFPDLKVIDLGGGLKVPYMPGEMGTDIRALGAKVAEEFIGFEKSTGGNLKYGLSLASLW